jgi:hypothetical protein
MGIKVNRNKSKTSLLAMAIIIGLASVLFGCTNNMGPAGMVKSSEEASKIVTASPSASPTPTPSPAPFNVGKIKLNTRTFKFEPVGGKTPYRFDFPSDKASISVDNILTVAPTVPFETTISVVVSDSTNPPSSKRFDLAVSNNLALAMSPNPVEVGGVVNLEGSGGSGNYAFYSGDTLLSTPRITAPSAAATIKVKMVDKDDSNLSTVEDLIVEPHVDLGITPAGSITVYPYQEQTFVPTGGKGNYILELNSTTKGKIENYTYIAPNTAPPSNSKIVELSLYSGGGKEAGETPVKVNITIEPESMISPNPERFYGEKDTFLTFSMPTGAGLNPSFVIGGASSTGVFGNSVTDIKSRQKIQSNCTNTTTSNVTSCTVPPTKKAGAAIALLTNFTQSDSENYPYKGELKIFGNAGGTNSFNFCINPKSSSVNLIKSGTTSQTIVAETSPFGFSSFMTGMGSGKSENGIWIKALSNNVTNSLSLSIKNAGFDRQNQNCPVGNSQNSFQLSSTEEAVEDPLIVNVKSPVNPGDNVVINVTGGVGSYNYSVNNVILNGNTFKAPADNGIITVAVGDSSTNPKVTAQVEVGNDLVLNLSDTEVGVNDPIDLSAGGGAPPYTFTRKLGTKGTVTQNADNVTATYIAPTVISTSEWVRVTDSNGIFKEAKIIVRSYSALVFQEQNRRLIPGENLTLHGQNGRSPYSMSLVEGFGEFNETTNVYKAPDILPDEENRKVVIELRDARGSWARTNIYLVPKVSLIVDPRELSNEVISGANGRVLKLNVTGGSGSYDFDIPNGKGTITGTPPAVYFTPSSYIGEVKVKAVDHNNPTKKSDEVIINVKDPIRIQTLPNAGIPAVSIGNNLDFKVTGGFGAYKLDYVDPAYGSVSELGVAGYRFTPNPTILYKTYVTLRILDSNDRGFENLSFWISKGLNMASLPSQILAGSTIPINVTGGFGGYNFTTVPPNSGDFINNNTQYKAPITATSNLKLVVTDEVGGKVEQAINILGPVEINPRGPLWMQTGGTKPFTPSGGYSGFSYLVNGSGDFSGNTYTAPLFRSTEKIRVKDSQGNQSNEVIINVVEPVEITMDKTNVFAASGNSVTINVTGGQTPYQFLRLKSDTPVGFTNLTVNSNKTSATFVPPVNMADPFLVIKVEFQDGGLNTLKTKEIRINRAPLVLTPVNPTLSSQTSITKQFSATGGSGTYIFECQKNLETTWTIMPNGLYTMPTSGGYIGVGTPLTIRVTDTSNIPLVRTTTLIVR